MRRLDCIAYGIVVFTLVWAVSSSHWSITFSSQGWTPLRWACHEGHLDIVKELMLNADVEVNAKDDLVSNTSCTYIVHVYNCD